MITDEALNEFIRNTINTIVDIEGFAIRADEITHSGYGAPRPLGSYATVKCASDLTLANVEYNRVNRDSDEDIDSSTELLTEVMVSLNFYRDGAKDYAKLVRSGMKRESILETFNEFKVGYMRSSNISDLTASSENGFEQIAHFDIFLNLVYVDTEKLTSILAVEIEGEYQTKDKSNFNIEVAE